MKTKQQILDELRIHRDNLKEVANLIEEKEELAIIDVLKWVLDIEEYKN